MPAPRRGRRSAAKKSQPPRSRRRRRDRFREYLANLARTGRLPAFLLSVGLSVVLVAFAVSDAFTVDAVVIRGNSIAYADSIVEASGAMGASVFRVNTERVAERVANHPAVSSAEVRVELPDRVVVNVVEREPAIVWQSDEQAVLIDEFGWVLAEGERDDQIEPERVAAVRHLDESFESSSTVTFSDNEGFVVHFPNQQAIVLGEAEQLPVKLQVVSAVQQREVDWTRLDVRDPERPYYQ